MFKKNSLPVLILIIILIIGFILRYWNIHQSFWWDEIWSTITYARADSLWKVVSSLGYYFNNHILYSLLCRASIKVLGESELSARLPALVMGLLGIFMLFQFGKKFVGSAQGLITSFLLAVSAFHIDHSTEARGYSGLVLFSILSSFYFLKALKTDKTSSWILYIIVTVLGFYTHVLMIAVSISQFFCSIILHAAKKLNFRIKLHKNAIRSFYYSIFVSGILTIIAYLPILKTFIKNMGNVRTVDVDRIPFIFDLLNSIFPGVLSVPGFILYSTLFFTGMFLIIKKDIQLFIYTAVLFFLPFLLYLLINPMFFFKRYFIFALPFFLLAAGCGIISLAELLKLKKMYRTVFIILFLSVLTYIQTPYIHKITTQDRQNYREAVQYVESETKDKEDVLLFSIGYAGEHFNYYSHTPITIPETFDEFKKIINKKKYIWCLITAWLPTIRPSYEDKAFYAEPPEHEKIYSYVTKNFTLQKEFFTKFPTQIYLLER